MQLRVRQLGALCVLALALTQAAFRFQDDEKTPLGKKMAAINTAFKAVGRQIDDPTKNASFRLPDPHRLVLRVGALRAELAPGASVELDGGTLVYEGLRSWMGYRVSYDWTLPWLLAAALLAALALAWHYTQRFFFAAPLVVSRAGSLPTPASARGAGDA